MVEGVEMAEAERVVVTWVVEPSAEVEKVVAA